MSAAMVVMFHEVVRTVLTAQFRDWIKDILIIKLNVSKSEYSF